MNTPVIANSDKHLENDKFATEKVSALKVKFLTPIVAMIVLVILVIAVSLFYFEAESRNFNLVHERLTHSYKVAGDYYEKALEIDTAALRSIYSGEEFAIILPETDPDSVHEYANRLLKVVSSLSFQIDNSLSIPITISIGLSSSSEQSQSETLLLAEADKALYKAKEAGRNRIEIL